MIRIAAILILFVLSGRAFSQETPPLERLVTLQLENKRLIEVMDEVEKQAGVSFSYNSNLLETEKMVSVKAINRPVREVMKKLLGEQIQFKNRKNYIILTRVIPQEKKVVVSGYVQTADGKPVQDATVYDGNTLASTNTSKYGYYEMKMERNSPTKLHVSKSSYRDTISPLKPHGGELRNIVLQEEKPDTTWKGRLNSWSDSTVVFFGRLGQELHPDSLFPKVDPVERAKRDSIRHERMQELADSTKAKWNGMKQWLLADSTRMSNVNDTIYRRAQISFVPYVGTNRKMSPHCINNFSFNILGGYNLGCTGFELGGMANIDRGDVSGFQLAGFTNIVGGNVSGGQIAGFANINRKNVSAIQIGGFTNINLGESDGAQIAGFTNINRKRSDGFMLAGFTNIVTDTAMGGMIAGFTNIVTKKSGGFQLAGFTNIALGEFKGTQISGFLNYGKNVKGTQIGFLNVADSLSGIPIGFLSFVKSGYLDLEIAANDLFYTNVALRTGVRNFYNILQAGVKPDQLDGNPIWTYGYGLGTSPRITDRLYLNVDVTANHIVCDTYQKFDFPTNVSVKLKSHEVLNLDNQLYLGAEFRVSKRFGVSAGAVVHGWLTERDVTYADIFEGSAPKFFENSNHGDVNLRMWWGWKVGLRLF